MSKNGILNSWKEIASYLRHSPRTVQRWEHLGLPVHRPAGPHHTVVAVISELDTWVRGRKPLATILCIDDNKEGLELRKAILETVGYRVLAASDGPGGLELFWDYDVNLVVLDYDMPRMNGEEVARVLRSRRAHVPILMLSGAEVLRTGVPSQFGVDAFLEKAAPVRELLLRVDQLLRRAKVDTQYSLPIPKLPPRPAPTRYQIRNRN